MRQVIKYPGSKWRIAKQIVELLPKHHSYLEPYFGSGAVLFNKQPSNIETINDLDSRVYTLFKMIREKPEVLARNIVFTPYSRKEYDLTFEKEPESDIDKSIQFLIQCWQGHGFRTNGYKVGWKNDVQGREKAYALWNWNRLPDWIMETAARLKNVQIECMDAVELIKRFNYPNVCIYADPPYLLETRAGRQYKHEMDDNEHLKLLETLLQHKGKVIISGYASAMYDDTLKGWYRRELKSNAEGGSIRKEILWMNYKPIESEQLKII